MTTGPATTRPAYAGSGGSSARTRATSSYTELAQLVRDSGLMRRRRGYYWATFASCALSAAALTLVAVRLGDSWLQLLVAAGLGLVRSQLGFLGHDAAHRQVFESRSWNEWSARLVSGLLVGLSYGWWRGKHNRHHAAPNQVDRDPDIAPGVLALTADQAGRRGRIGAWCTRRQGWLLFPLLFLEGLNLHLGAVRDLLTTPRPHRSLELVLVVTRFAALVAVLLLLLPVGKGAAFLGVQVAVFGFFLGGAFVPNHTGMPVVPASATLDFLRRQVLVSRNIRGGRLVDLAMGGLNFQVEHHLFPSMPRPHLKLVQPLVRAHCAHHDVTYTEATLVEAYSSVVRHLNEVGLAQRSPTCPLAASLRD